MCCGWIKEVANALGADCEKNCEYKMIVGKERVVKIHFNPFLSHYQLSFLSYSITSQFTCPNLFVFPHLFFPFSPSQPYPFLPIFYSPIPIFICMCHFCLLLYPFVPIYIFNITHSYVFCPVLNRYAPLITILTY